MFSQIGGKNQGIMSIKDALYLQKPMKIARTAFTALIPQTYRIRFFAIFFYYSIGLYIAALSAYIYTYDIKNYKRIRKYICWRGV
jgi:hypothetical protein